MTLLTFLPTDEKVARANREAVRRAQEARLKEASANQARAGLEAQAARETLARLEAEAVEAQIAAQEARLGAEEALKKARETKAAAEAKREAEVGGGRGLVLASNWVRLAPNGTNPGLFQFFDSQMAIFRRVRLTPALMITDKDYLTTTTSLGHLHNFVV